ncbi:MULTISPECIES: hypothetical protein [unclassified Serratia (in: enterobacteria)]|uniref:hypothetical protein n=1 Tax=unclassified Serratia (in: enterobacteria) TaxID=2647522 RepID=UPI0018ABE53C|nr:MULTISPECIES: hypothetical protein [unclassified Serratia (in: enterobacteria)]
MPKPLPHNLQGWLYPLVLAIVSVFFAEGTFAAEKTASAPQEIAKNLEFDASFLNVDDEKSVDFSRISNTSSALPIVYKTSLYANEKLVRNIFRQSQ